MEKFWKRISVDKIHSGGEGHKSTPKKIYNSESSMH